MHSHSIEQWTHDHAFLGEKHDDNERRTWFVVVLTLVMMVGEIVAGSLFGSMALLADGWHMSTHVAAFLIAALAYAYSRRRADDPRYSFGTGKVGVLGGFASAILLLGVATMMVFGSIERILLPQPIHYAEAMVVAALGLVVNIVCAVILGRAHDHHHHDDGHDDHGHHHENHGDLNLKAAYLHVIADAATSVLAIVALGGGWLYGWSWLDPAMGIVGAVLVAVWARKLLIETGKVLLDREMDHPVVAEIREAVEIGSEEEGNRLTDLHVWRVGKNAYACALSIVTHDTSLTPAHVRQQLAQHEEIVHATIEIQRCQQ